MKTLVAFFSVTNNTKKVAIEIADAIKADTFAITPVNPYTSVDLNWKDKTSRTTLEMKNKVFRPKIERKLDNIKPYRTIFLGFPIWWYVAPSIIKTFLESYNFADKRIILFATSGESDFGETAKILRECCPNATIEEGRVFKSPTSEEIVKWVKSLSL